MIEHSLTISATNDDIRQMPGHWVLAKLGKRVLRPGGLELTQQMLDALNIQPDDRVVEFAPGMGVTARITLSRRPAAYTAIERDEIAAERMARNLTHPHYRCLLGSAEETGLPDETATVVYGEAMLTMQTHTAKQQIIAEARRVLRPDGRYGIHELCLVPDAIDPRLKARIQTDVSKAIRVSARPLTVTEWRDLLEDAGFSVDAVQIAPMHLLEPRRIYQDEGLRRALRFAWNVLMHPQTRKRVLGMRSVFRIHRQHLAAVMMIVTKS